MKKLDEAIERFNHNAEYERTHGNLQGCLEFRQLAEWLVEFKELKAVQPEQRTGKWIPHEVKLPDRTILNYTCSACGRKLIGYGTETLNEVPYCHCGAKMIEPQESEVEDGNDSR